METEAQMRARVERQRAAVAQYLASLPNAFSPIPDPALSPVDANDVERGGRESSFTAKEAKERKGKQAVDALPSHTQPAPLPPPQQQQQQLVAHPIAKEERAASSAELQRQPTASQQSTRRSSLPYRNPHTAAVAAKASAEQASKQALKRSLNAQAAGQDKQQQQQQHADPATGPTAAAKQTQPLPTPTPPPVRERTAEEEEQSRAQMAELIAAAIVQQPAAAAAATPIPTDSTPTHLRPPQRSSTTHLTGNHSGNRRNNNSNSSSTLVGVLKSGETPGATPRHPAAAAVAAAEKTSDFIVKVESATGNGPSQKKRGNGKGSNSCSTLDNAGLASSPDAAKDAANDKETRSPSPLHDAAAAEHAGMPGRKKGTLGMKKKRALATRSSP